MNWPFCVRFTYFSASIVEGKRRKERVEIREVRSYPLIEPLDPLRRTKLQGQEISEGSKHVESRYWSNIDTLLVSEAPKTLHRQLKSYTVQVYKLLRSISSWHEKRVKEEEKEFKEVKLTKM